MLKRTGTFIIMLTLPTLAGSFANTSWAEALPPPVRQEIGIFDAVFNALSERECLNCHDADIGDIHHPLISVRQYACGSCHVAQANSISTNCLLCHEQQPGDASVHHLTEKAQFGDCVVCHQSVVQNRTDEHYIPSYPATMITPRPSKGLGPEGRGSCQFCHDWGNDGTTGALIFSNARTHHETGFDNCLWCHGLHTGTALAIRACEQCHAPLSIHNIQVDSNGDGVITPGGEEAYYGHIGNNDDCLGCHGGFSDATAAVTQKGTIDKPTRHHLLVQTKDKKCLECHKLIRNQEGFFVFADFRTCSNCHGRHRN